MATTVVVNGNFVDVKKHYWNMKRVVLSLGRNK